MLRKLARNPGALLSALILTAMVFSGLFAPLVSPHDPVAQNATRRLLPPVWAEKGSAENLLGTDHLGRDILSRMIFGSRVSLMVGASAVVVSGLIGVGLGLLSGYYGRWVDAILMRLADIQLGVPTLVLALAIVAVLGPGLRNMILVLGLTGWVTYGRLVRSESLTIKELDYVQGARALGASDLRIMFRHVMPNVMHSVIVVATFEFARMIINEASLSFLGLGVPPPTPTWGGMVADGRTYIYNAWWVSTIPGFAIILTVLAANIFGDWVRDMLDPQLRRQVR